MRVSRVKVKVATQREQRTEVQDYKSTCRHSNNPNETLEIIITKYKNSTNLNLISQSYNLVTQAQTVYTKRSYKPTQKTQNDHEKLNQCKENR